MTTNQLPNTADQARRLFHARDWPAFFATLDALLAIDDTDIRWALGMLDAALRDAGADELDAALRGQWQARGETLRAGLGELGSEAPWLHRWQEADTANRQAWLDYERADGPEALRRALDLADRSQAFFPHNPAMQDTRVRLLLALGRQQDAWEVVRQVEAIVPGWPDFADLRADPAWQRWCAAQGGPPELPAGLATADEVFPDLPGLADEAPGSPTWRCALRAARVGPDEQRRARNAALLAVLLDGLGDTEAVLATASVAVDLSAGTWPGRAMIRPSTLNKLRHHALLMASCLTPADGRRARAAIGQHLFVDADYRPLDTGGLQAVLDRLATKLGIAALHADQLGGKPVLARAEPPFEVPRMPPPDASCDLGGGVRMEVEQDAAGDLRAAWWSVAGRPRGWRLEARRGGARMWCPDGAAHQETHDGRAVHTDTLWGEAGAPDETPLAGWLAACAGRILDEAMAHALEAAEQAREQGRAAEAAEIAAALAGVLRRAGRRKLATALRARFDPGAASPASAWRRGPALALERSGVRPIALADGGVLVTGGQLGDSFLGNTRPCGAVERWDPDTGRWCELPPLLRARMNHTATALLDGSVLVAGGVGPVTAGVRTLTPTSCERWSPQTGRCEPVAALAHPRSFHSAVRLADGRVLVLGGGPVVPRGDKPLLWSTELYDPDADAWSTGPELPQRSDVDAALLLDDGRLLVIGSRGPLAHIWRPGDPTFLPEPTLAGRAWQGACRLDGGSVLLWTVTVRQRWLDFARWTPATGELIWLDEPLPAVKRADGLRVLPVDDGGAVVLRLGSDYRATSLRLVAGTWHWQGLAPPRGHGRPLKLEFCRLADGRWFGLDGSGVIAGPVFEPPPTGEAEALADRRG